MVAHKLKDNLFFEKIGNVIYRQKETDEILSSIICSNKFPCEINLKIQVDLFNIKIDTEYMLVIVSMDEKLDSDYLVVSKFVSKKEKMLLNIDNNEFGNMVIYFEAILNSEVPKHKVLNCMLVEVSNDGNVLDDNYTYLTFASEVNIDE